MTINKGVHQMVATATMENRINNRFLRDNDGIKVTASIRKRFPAVFAKEAASHMSDEYQLFRSDKIIEEMDKMNFALVEIRQLFSVKRDPAFTAHSLRFRPVGRHKPLAKVGDTIAEAHIINSHNGLTKLVASSGLFRLACLNGLVVPDALYGSATMRHFGSNNTFEVVQEIVRNMMEKLPSLSQKIEAWKKIKLIGRQQINLAKLLLQVRPMPEWIEPSHVLEAHREEDAVARSGTRDLWTTFNVLQENIMNRKITMPGDEDTRGSSTRPVTGAIVTYELNRKLWLAAERAATALDAGKGIPATFEDTGPEVLGEEPRAAAKPSAREDSAVVAKRAIAKAQRSAAAGRSGKRKIVAAPKARKASGKTVATGKKATEAFKAKRAAAARAYRARLKADVMAGVDTHPETA